MASTQDDVVVRLRLKDVAKFIADVKSGKLAIEDLEKKISQAGRTASSASSPSGGLGKLGAHFGMLAGFAKTGALALGAATIGVAGYAVKSAASMEQVSVSMETMLGSAARARSMMSTLQTFARDTPFEFGDVAKQAQHLLAFGFAANSVKGTLTAVGNAASGLGLGAEGMDRIVTSLGQMRMKGRVQGDEMLQLAEAGINANAYLERAFHMTPQQLQAAQQAGKISAAKAIPVILKGMDDQFRGLMEKQSHTLGGMWSNFHDAMQQGLVRLVNPFMPAMKHWLGEVTNYLGDTKNHQGMLSRAAKFMQVLPGNITAGRADFAAYNVGAIIGNHRFDPAIEKGVRVVHDLGVIVKDVLIPALKDLAVVLAPVVLVMEHLDQITGFVADHSTGFKIAVDVLAGSLIAYRLAAIGLNAAIATYNTYIAIAGVRTVAFTEATTAQRLAMISLKGVTVAYMALNGAAWWAVQTAGLLAYSAAMWALRAATVAWIEIKFWAVIIRATVLTRLWTAAQWLLNIAMDSNPIGAVILVVGLLATAFVVAYQNIKPFREFINGLWADMRGFQKWIVEVWNPTQWSSHAGATGQTIAPGLVGGDPNVAAQNGGTAAHPGPLISLMGHAAGGIMTQTHTAWVGERGPEMVTLPRGSAVIPLPRVPEFAGRGPIHVHVMVDKREIAQAVYDDMGDRVARR